MTTTKTKQELLQMLANATKTHYQCNGHGKAERNEMLAERYKNELRELGESIPTDEELLKVGKFNGEGSV